MANQSFLRLQGKRVIVTGASAGIGQAIALEFACQGSHLMLCGRDHKRLHAVANRCQQLVSSSTKICLTVGDITDETNQHTIIERTVKELGGIDILVNNAGVLTKGDHNTSWQKYKSLMATNLDSVFFLTQLAVPHLKKTKGNIVNISSIVADRPSPNVMVYSMSKAALDSYTKALALRLASDGIRVNSVNPGSVVSLIYRRGEEAMSDEEYAKFASAMSSPDVHPLGRMGGSNEVADSVVYLASDRASFVTGQILYVDGGRQIVSPSPKL